jgi:hypothetical protein
MDLGPNSADCSHLSSLKTVISTFASHGTLCLQHGGVMALGGEPGDRGAYLSAGSLVAICICHLIVICGRRAAPALISLLWLELRHEI